MTRIENACATGNDAIRNGVYGVASGMLDVVLVAGADKVRESSARGTFWEWMGLTRDMAWDYPIGVVAPANFALHVNRYLHESPATREHLAMVAVKNHHHGVSNPKAQLRFEITIEDVLNAPIVVEPFGLYDCTPQSDGAAALLLVGEEVVDRYTDRPVWVRGVGLGLDRVMHQHKADMTTFPPTVKAAKQAYAMAGVGPADIDVAEVHDCFTGVELIDYEDLGFCDRFGACRAHRVGRDRGGRAAAREPERRAEGEGPPAGRHRHRAVRRAVRAAARRVDQPGRRCAGRASPTTSAGPTAVSAVTILGSDKD